MLHHDRYDDDNTRVVVVMMMIIIIIIIIPNGWPTAVQDFSLFHSVQTGSGAHPASYPMGSAGSFPGHKAAGA
jgi:hypothetical protein